MKWNHSAACVLAVVAALLPVALFAQQPTQAQIEAFRSLPAAEQQRLLNQAGAAAQPSIRYTPIEPVAERPARNAPEEENPLTSETRVQTGDTLVITISGEAPAALRGRRVVQVDPEGRVRLPSLDRIMLAGLDAGQAADRLNAERALEHAQVRVQVMPVRRSGLASLKPYGYELFRDPPTTFAPTAAVSVPREYIIGPGDVVHVQVFGNQPALHALEVTREGQLLFPQLGPVPVSGMTFAELQQQLSQRIEDQIIGARAVITMGPLRSIRIFVLGEAGQPGAYTVSALSTVTHALFVSGGARQVGSLRNIQVKRGGDTVATLDLYDLLLKGDTAHDIRLQPDDVVFIPPAGTQVAIDGEVRRPAIYELRAERTVNELVLLAGGLQATAYAPLTTIERISQRSGERELITVDLTQDAGRNARLQPGDYVSVASVLDRIDGMVRVTGHVHRPQVREWREGLTVRDLIGDINALQQQPDLDYALLRRETGPTRTVTVESVALAEVLAGDANPPVQPNDELIVFGIDETDERRARIAGVLDSIRLQATATEPNRIVSVTGPVRASGDYPLEPGMTVSELIRAGGGLSEAAYGLEAEITRLSVTGNDEHNLDHFTVDLDALLAGNPGADIALQPRDVLTIKTKPYWAERASVQLRGEVRFPGEYSLRRNERISDVIERAGGLTDEAYPHGAVFMREDLRAKEQEQIDLMADRLETEVATAHLGNPDTAAQQAAAAGTLSAQLRRTRAAGRLVIDLPAALADRGNPEYDVDLNDGDTLVIPRHPREVTIIGEVHYPTSHLWQDDRNLDGYVRMSGGTTTRADVRQIYIVRANGAVEEAFPGRARRAAEVLPGDTIIVPIDVDRVPRLTLWTNISQIFYQIGIATAAWKSVGGF